MTTFAVSTWVASEFEVGEAIEKLGVAGFDRVEISCAQSPLGRAWERDPVALVGLLESAGLRACSVHDPDCGRFLDVVDGDRRDDAVGATAGYVRRCRDSGIGLVVVHATSTSELVSGDTAARWFGRSRDSLGRLSELARDCGVRLAVETLPGHDGQRPDETVAGLLRLIEGLGDHVGICIDVGHTWMSGHDPVPEIAAAGDRLFSLHVHDVKGGKHDHHLPGEGELAFGPMLDQLDAMDFRGLVVLEISPKGEAIDRAMAALNTIRGNWLRRKSAGAAAIGSRVVPP